ncbi:MAG TPA: CheR family methyltransferase [Spirochaetota bacterium]|nr:CheR family methyltransferase [Spirochaetota bacterium]HPQ52374.1 CheR family methyltransferase [Spirochaetota bacterium]
MIKFPEIKRLTEEEFRQFAKLIYTESGIFLKDTKITLLSNRLRKRLQALNLDSFTDYYEYIGKLSDKSKEIEALIDVVSTNETYFFRNERQFDALMEHCFKDIAEKKKGVKKLRIWSAGCSTGEEPYTIAICVLENRHLFEGWSIEIVATDIAPSVLDFARKGEYSGRRIEKVPPALLQKYFTQNKDYPELYTVKDEVKKIVSFRYLNLFKTPYPENMDVVFCRNVMIYFDKEHQRKLISGFFNVLLKTGYLFIGHSETLHSISEDFSYLKILESPVYIPKEE